MTNEWGMDPNEMRWAAHIVSDELTDKDTCPVCVEHALWEALPTIKRAIVKDLIEEMIADVTSKLTPEGEIGNARIDDELKERIKWLRSFLTTDAPSDARGQ